MTRTLPQRFAAAQRASRRQAFHQHRPLRAVSVSGETNDAMVADRGRVGLPDRSASGGDLFARI